MTRQISTSSRPACVACLLLAAVLLVRGDAAAQQLVSVNGDRVSVVAEDVPLEILLDRFGELVSLRVTSQPGVGERRVTISLEAVPIVFALQQVLRAAGVDFVLSGDDLGQPMRLVVGHWPGSDAPQPFTDPAHPELIEAQAGGLPAETVAEPIEEDEEAEPMAAGTTSGPPAGSDLTSVERLTRLLTPAGPRPRAGTYLTLPFPGPDGQPLTVLNDPPPPGVVRLPFPDANGEPLEIVVPPRKPGHFTLPFPGPDGQPEIVGVAPEPGSKRPGERH